MEPANWAMASMTTLPISPTPGYVLSASISQFFGEVWKYGFESEKGF